MNAIRRHCRYRKDRIGFTCDNMEIIIYTEDPDIIPHFHFKLDDIKGCIEILNSKYYSTKYFKYTLNSNQILHLIQFLKSPYRNNHYKTYWNRLIDSWNTNNSYVQVLDDYPMPDYLNIEE